MPSKKHIETSKKLLWTTAIMFSCVLIAGIICTYKGLDTSYFMYAIPSVGGIFGATIIFYLNKAKMENILKGKAEFLKFRLELMQNQSPDTKAVVEQELQVVDDTLNSTIDDTLQETISEKIDVMPMQ